MTRFVGMCFAAFWPHNTSDLCYSSSGKYPGAIFFKWDDITNFKRDDLSYRILIVIIWFIAAKNLLQEERPPIEQLIILLHNPASWNPLYLKPMCAVFIIVPKPPRSHFIILCGPSLYLWVCVCECVSASVCLRVWECVCVFTCLLRGVRSSRGKSSNALNRRNLEAAQSPGSHRDKVSTQTLWIRARLARGRGGGGGVWTRGFLQVKVTATGGNEGHLLYVECLLH